MVYRPHTLVTFGGTLTERGGQDEIWQCGIRGFGGVRGQSTNLPIQGNQDQYLSEIHAALAAWFNAGTSFISANAYLAWVKCNNIGPDGRYSDDTTHAYDYTTPSSGGVSGTLHPSFLSVATSFTTPRRRPPAAFGRIYLPNFVIAVSAGSTISSANQAAVQAAGLALLDVIANQDSEEAAFDPHIVSNVGAAFQPITGVRVGNVYDVQRRRKDALPEIYTSDATWPTS